MHRILRVLTAAIVLFAPFHEGGRDPFGLLILHTLSIIWVLCACAAGALRRPGLRDAAPDPLRPLVLAGGAALLAVGASALRAAYPLAAGLGAWDIVLPCALFVAAARLPERGDDLLRMRILVAASTAGQAVLALARYADRGIEAAGESFLNRNHLAAFLNLGFFLCLSAIDSPAVRRGGRLLWGAVAAVNLAALGLLESRGAFLALLGILLVFGARRFGIWTRRARVAAALLVLACGLVALLALRDRLGRGDDPYRYHRLSIWKASWQILAERPLLGHGPGMFPHVAANHTFPDDHAAVRYGRVFSGAHCAYLTLAAEIGLPALLCLVAVGCGLLVLFLRRGDRTEQGTALAGCALGIMALLAQGVVDDLQERPALTLTPALLAGIALAAVRCRRDATAPVGLSPGPPPPVEPEGSRPRLRALGWGGALAGMGAVYLLAIAVVLPFLADRDARQAQSLGREGLPLMRRAATLDPLQPEYRHDLAMAILNSGPLTADGYAEAESDLLEARRLKPIDYRFPLLQGRMRSRLAPRVFTDGTVKESAAALYGEAVRLAPLNPLPRLELAALLAELQRPAEALATVREALLLEPNFIRARILEASILLDMGRVDEARDALSSTETTLTNLAHYTPDSGYAREITLDAPAERDRLAQRLDQRSASAALRF